MITKDELIEYFDYKNDLTVEVIAKELEVKDFEIKILEGLIEELVKEKIILKSKNKKGIYEYDWNYDNVDVMIFDNKGIEPGNKILINSKIYQVLTVTSDAHPAPERKDFPARMYLRIDLHDNESKTLMPTHELDYYYEDTKELVLVDFKNKKELKINILNIRIIK